MIDKHLLKKSEKSISSSEYYEFDSLINYILWKQ